MEDKILYCMLQDLGTAALLSLRINGRIKDSGYHTGIQDSQLLHIFDTTAAFTRFHPRMQFSAGYNCKIKAFIIRKLYIYIFFFDNFNNFNFNLLNII